MDEIVLEQLFQEDLNSKMPVLLKQFPEYGEDFIRQVAQADPTGNRADYITWMLRMLRAKQWEVTDADSMRELLTGFDRVKRVAEFADERDINQYTVLDDLVAVVDRNKDLKSKNEQEAQRRVEGAEKLNQVGSYSLFRLTTPEAATFFGRGKGGKANPSTVWCTKDPAHSKGYLEKGPLYTVVKDGEPYVQFHFPRSEAKDKGNGPLKAPMGLEIGPVCAAITDEFESRGFTYKPPGYFLSDQDIDRYLDGPMKRKFIAQRYHGHWKNGVWFEPVTDMEALEARWEKARPAFYRELTQARQNNDQELIKQAGRRNPEPAQLQAIYNGVYEFNHAHTQPA